MKYTLFCLIAIVFFSCKNNSKSPIDITNTEKEEKHLIYFVDYFEVNKLVINNKSTFIEIPLIDENNFVTINDSAEYSGKDFKLQKICIYSPSIHTLNQKHFAAEIIFFHQDTSNNNLIISLLVEKGSENNAFSKILSNLPNKSATSTLNITLDLFELLPQQNKFYYYEGSTLDKPFENAKWIILKDYIEFSQEQFVNLETKISNSNIKPILENKIKVFEN